MKLESKYDIGDKVFGINLQRKQIEKPCPGCDGTGELELKNGEKIECDRCYNFGYTTSVSWMHSVTNLTIGRICIEITDTSATGDPDTIFDNYSQIPYSRKEEYMCVETGVGTGRVWKVDLLYKTEEEAKKECTKRNKELKQKEQNDAKKR